MTDLLPLFPLGTVLFPGAPMPLHIFEERYRHLVRDLVRGSGRRWFGVVAIRRGSEVGDQQPELYDVGCVAMIRRVEAYPDGRYDIVAAGGPRFRIGQLDTTLPYLRASVTLLVEERGADAAKAAASARAALTAYWDVLCSLSGEAAELTAPVDEPLDLSYAAASVLQIDLRERQALLECETAVERIASATALLRRETALLKHLAAVRPGDDFASGPVSLN